MSLNNFTLLTGPSVVFDGGEGETVAGDANATAGTEVVQDTGSTTAQGQPAGGSSWGTTGMLLYIAGLVALFYFFIIRPQKKREKELVNLQDSIETGSWIITSSGLYGKVMDVYATEILVEFGTNKGIMIPVRKSDIIGIKEPELKKVTQEDKDK